MGSRSVLTAVPMNWPCVAVEIAQAQARNAELFHNATQQLFRSLYHEAFHAYLENYVYPQSSHDVLHVRRNIHMSRLP